MKLGSGTLHFILPQNMTSFLFICYYLKVNFSKKYVFLIKSLWVKRLHEKNNSLNKSSMKNAEKMYKIMLKELQDYESTLRDN